MKKQSMGDKLIAAVKDRNEKRRLYSEAVKKVVKLERKVKWEIIGEYDHERLQKSTK